MFAVVCDCDRVVIVFRFNDDLGRLAGQDGQNGHICSSECTICICSKYDNNNSSSRPKTCLQTGPARMLLQLAPKANLNLGNKTILVLVLHNDSFASLRNVYLFRSSLLFQLHKCVCFECDCVSVLD